MDILAVHEGVVTAAQFDCVFCMEADTLPPVCRQDMQYKAPFVVHCIELPSNAVSVPTT